MSEVTMNFNKTDLSDLIEIHDIQRDVGNNRSILIDRAPRIGVNIQQQTIDAKYIKVDFSIWSKDRNTLKHKLAGIFNVDAPKELTFSDEPDKYYLAMAIDDISMQEVSGRRSNGSIKFIVPDGVAHSSAYKNFNSDSNAQTTTDKMVFDLVNNGTVEAFPIIRVKHNAENGYIGLVNNNTAFEMGNREEADTEPVKRSEVLLDFRGDKIADGFARAVKNTSVTNSRWDNITGTSELTTVDGKKRIKVREQASGAYNENYGAGLSWEIPADSTGQKGSLNDYLFCKLVYQLESINQCGFIKVAVSDTAGQFLYGIETYKRYNGLYCGFNVFATDNAGGYNFLKTLLFDSSSDKNTNPFALSKGQFELQRNDERVQVYYNGSHYDFIVPEIKGKKSAKIHVTIGAFRGKAIIPHLYLDELMYRKDFVQASRDIPNRYPMGSNVVINSEDDTVYIDGIAKAGEVVDGSQWLSIPPGESKIEMYFSSFIKKKPTVTIEFEERWL
ncbi:phage tail family protein [Streptococcus sp. DTU_2020_1001019_1_SI_AUS_MUR_006]|uniref:distal tail protein Dit n=1 Tax=Streptococcus sp. DTU_2020_1001019_1_SI_AUS_MUR_006 TaxID=3077584 RepID=UPI002069B846|nr:distal tail protein Dit [Streptococcus sp. DTU_2020_1001019_1_SI_AUS_MUR_006]WNS72611.1 phage tail family protein [Streptococcus sp. DTU_2020_1001019_1_SI_AUS_MUR_006]DAR85009.1 MAG TPA: distal tail protein [Caudoviricetes sp.]